MTWANSTGETVDPVNVASGYVYGPAGNQLTGTNGSITSTDPTMTPANWSGSFGMEQPAPTAVAVGVAIPGIGVGTAPAVIPPTTEIPCDLEPKTLNASCGQIKTCLLYTSPSPRDQRGSRMPSSA